MSEEELIETLRAFEKNRVEQLEEPARNLFYAIMKIEGERDRLNNIIEEVREYIKQTGQYLEDIKRFKVDVLEPDYLNILEILDRGSDKE